MKSGAEKLRDKYYYRLAHQGSSDLSHPAMKIFLKLFQKSESVLDMGCGEGTRLATLVKVSGLKRPENIFGIDASKIAISLAKKRYPAINFRAGNLEKMDFKDQQFDLLISAYVFEHLENPEKVFKEGQRMLKDKGKFMIIAPNFGAPNRRSPNSNESKVEKLIQGFFNDLKMLFSISNLLNWKKVVPRKGSYTIDSDTTVEPYLLSLVQYSNNLKFEIEYCSSNWEVDKFSIFQLPFRVLGMLGIYPFKYWGPHLAIILVK